MSGVARCLDGQIMRDQFTECIDWPSGVRVEDVSVRRFTPRPQGRFDVEYTVRVSGPKIADPTVVTLFCRYPTLDAETPETEPVVSADVVSGVYCNIAALDVTIHSMDQDPAFPQFGYCVDAGEMSRRIGKLLAEGSDDSPAPSADSLACKPISFRRGRRFVVRYDETAGPLPHRAWAGKCYVDDRGRKLAKLHRHLAKHFASFGDGSVLVPRLLGYEADLRMAITEWNDVQDSMPLELTGSLLAQRSAKALAALHSCPVLPLRKAKPDRYWNTLLRWHELIVELQPSLARVAGELLHQLDDARKRFEPSCDVATHGDFYESQIIVGENTTTILDLDTLAAGDRCIDVGNSLAHALLWCLEQGRTYEEYTAMSRSLLKTYESEAKPVNDPSLAYYWAATLFRAGALHSFRKHTACHTAQLWATVIPVLTEGRNTLESPRNGTPVSRRTQSSQMTIERRQAGTN